MAAQLALRRQAMEENEARELGLLYGCPEELMAMRRAAFGLPGNVPNVLQVSKRPMSGTHLITPARRCVPQANKDDSKELAVSEEAKPGSPEALREPSALLDRNALLSDKVFAADVQARRDRSAAETSGTLSISIAVVESKHEFVF